MKLAASALSLCLASLTVTASALTTSGFSVPSAQPDPPCGFSWGEYYPYKTAPGDSTPSGQPAWWTNCDATGDRIHLDVKWSADEEMCIPRGITQRIGQAGNFSSGIRGAAKIGDC